jgi:methylase of polypeptide subunit release factors
LVRRPRAAVAKSIEATSQPGRSGVARTPSPRPQRLLDRAIHFLSYQFILSRRRATISHAAGLRLAVPPTVFHPRYFLTSEFFAAFIAGLDLTGKRVADLGTGTGILALAAARAGAADVLAIDINPNAARAAAENASANGLGARVTSMCSDLFAGVSPKMRFDVIVSNPPFFMGEPLDLADRAWHAGPGYRDIAPLFEQSRERLAPGGSMYVVLSSHADLDLFGAMIGRAGLRAHIAAERSIWIETLIVYVLRPL